MKLYVFMRVASRLLIDNEESNDANDKKEKKMLYDSISSI